MVEHEFYDRFYLRQFKLALDHMSEENSGLSEEGQVAASHDAAENMASARFSTITWLTILTTIARAG